MTAAAGTSTGAVAWARRQLGASSAKIAHWNSQAPGEWCGVWLAALMRSAGIKPPAGYQAAINWSTFGTAVKPGEEQPGDVLVYGSNHVAFYTGNKEQIQGNDQNGSVGASGIGSGLGLGPITAIRRPPYQGSKPSEFSSFGPLGTLEEVVTAPSRAIAGVIEGKGKEAAEDAGGAVITAFENLLGEKAVPILLNVGLVGGGAFLAYFGIARMVGVGHPVKTPIAAAAKAGAVAAV